jgi:hypothetical protein
VGRSDPFHVQTKWLLSALEEYGFLGKELSGNALLFVKNRGITCDFVVSSLSRPEPFLRISFSGCTAVCDHRGQHEECQTDDPDHVLFGIAYMAAQAHHGTVLQNLHWPKKLQAPESPPIEPNA